MSELVEAAKLLLAMIEKETKFDHDSELAADNYVYIKNIEGAQTRLTLAIDFLEVAGRLEDVVNIINQAKVRNPKAPITISPPAYGAILEAIDCWKENQEDGHLQK